MAEWLDVDVRGKDHFVNVQQMAGREAKSELFCRNCSSMQPAFGPSQIAYRKKCDLVFYVVPAGFTLRTFCAVCGWMYRKIPIGRRLRQEVVALDHGECVYCGSKCDLEIDHLRPELTGGQNTIENLVACCWGCNIEKGRNQTYHAPTYGRFRTK